MENSIKKPRSFNSLAAKNDRGSVQIHVKSNAILHAERIAQIELLKKRAKDQEQFIFGLAEEVEGDTDLGKSLKYYALRMAACCHYLMFRNYYRIDETKLVKAHTCQLHLLCPVCAHNRAAKSVRAYTEKFEEIRKAKPRLKPILITLTVKNGDDLEERFEHLKDAFKNLLDRRRDSLKKRRGYVEFSKIEGAVYSFEFTKSEENGWHPHVHMLALVNDWIDRDMLVAEWQEVTKDSFIVDVRRIRSKVENGLNLGYAKAFCEVFKYAMKFSDLSYADTLTAFYTLRSKRLTGSIGCFRGVDVPEGIEDEFNAGDEPYLELLYKWKNRNYDLVATRSSTDDDQNDDDKEVRREARRTQSSEVSCVAETMTR